MALSDVVINIDLNAEDAIDEADRLQDRLRHALNTIDGRHATAELQRIVTSIKQAEIQSRNLQERLVELQDTTPDGDEGAAELAQQIESTTVQLEQCNDRMRLLHQSLVDIGPKGAAGFKEISSAVNNLSQVSTIFNKVNGHIQSVNNKMKSLISGAGKFVAKLFSANSAVKGLNGSLNKTEFNMKKLIRAVTQYGLGFRSVYFLVRKIRSFIISGFSNILSFMDDSGTDKVQQDFKDFYDAIQRVKTALETLRYAFVAAFTPLVTTVAPYIEQAINWLVKLIGYVGQLIAVLTGSSYYWTVNEKGIKKVTDAQKKQNKEQNKQLSNLDKLNNITTKKDSSKDTSAYNPADLFKKAPVESWIKDLADKLKKIISDLLYPIKTAWDAAKRYVLAGWKYMVNRMGSLLKQIWSDFITIWKQPKTVLMFYEIFHILGDILFIIGEFADKLRIALQWEQNGLKIFEAIRDIVASIVHHLHNMVEATLDWVTKLDLRPIVTSFRMLLESVVPVIDTLGGIVEDFWKQVTLPFAKFLLEDFFPKLFDRFREFNEALDLQGLRKAFSSFWSELEPVLENIANAIYLIVDGILNLLTAFINTGSTGIPVIDAILSVIQGLWNTLKTLSPEQILGIAKGLVGIVAAITAMSAVSSGLASTVSGLAGLSKVVLLLGEYAPIVLGVVAALTALVGVIAIGVGGEIGGDAFLKGLPEQLNKIVQAIQDFIANVNFTALGKTIADNFDTFMQSIDWGNIAETISQGLAGIVDFMASLWSSIDWDSLIVSLVDMLAKLDWGALSESWAHMFFTSITVAMKLVWGLIKSAPIIFVGIIKAISEILIGAVQGFAQSLADKFREIGFDSVAGLIQGFADKIGEIETKISEWANSIINWWKELFGIHSPSTVFAEIGTNLIQGLINGISAMWTALQSKIQAITDGVKNKFVDMKNKVIEVWNALKNGIKTPINAIISAIEKFINGMISGINKVTSMLSNIRFDIPSWVPEIGGNSFNLSIPSIPTISIPRLAQGTVVPPSASEFMAMLGDNNNETEVVSPLSTMTEAFKTALADMDFGGGSNDVSVNIDGQKLFNIMVGQNTRHKKRTGKNAFA